MWKSEALRSQFPALQREIEGIVPIFLDGPGGSQVPRRVAEAMSDYLLRYNANHGGVFHTSRESDRMIAEAHKAAADFLNAPSPDEIVFGANMTTLTFHLSRSFARTLRPGDEILVTRLDHDANVSPWVRAAQDAGAIARKVDVRPSDCLLDLEDLQRQLSPRTRLVAVGAASNLVGSLTEVREVTRLAHRHGALVFVDAVHAAPHLPLDVQEWDCDFLACSAYKFFGPHLGILWGRRALLEELPAYKLRPATEQLPDRWMTGTQNHEGLAGLLAAFEYLAEIGESAPEHRASFPRMSGRALALHCAMAAIREYERGLTASLLSELRARPRYRVVGVSDPEKLAQRAPTVSIVSETASPLQMAEQLATRQIYAWNGNCYALELTERLGLEERGGTLRLGLMHYNTPEEVARLLKALDEIR